jgi:hypothetical protein
VDLNITVSKLEIIELVSLINELVLFSKFYVSSNFSPNELDKKNEFEDNLLRLSSVLIEEITDDQLDSTNSDFILDNLLSNYGDLMSIFSEFFYENFS